MVNEADMHFREYWALSIENRLDAIEKRHAEHDAGLKAMATEPKAAGGEPASEAMGIRINPCTHCGSDGVFNASHRRIMCTDFACGAKGPVSRNEVDLAAEWNRHGDLLADAERLIEQIDIIMSSIGVIDHDNLALCRVKHAVSVCIKASK